MTVRQAAEYVLPLRWDDATEAVAAVELGEYLAWLASRVDVTVVDGSPPQLFAAHRRDWPAVRIMPPSVPGRNGKARGAMTGILVARHPRVVIADDDVRYDQPALDAVLDALERADVVRPQNVWTRRPWHARWDTGRTLLNRAFGGDYSGTVGVRAELARPGYDTDVLFENLELERTVRARGGRVVVARGLYVGRHPASGHRFGEQRVRQAYDSFAQPRRLLVELALAPVAVTLARRHPFGLAVAAGAIVAAAEVGRRRDGGAEVFGATDALWALPWAGERAITSWIAVWWRLRGGVPYRGTKLRRAANSLRRLRKKERR